MAEKTNSGRILGEMCLLIPTANRPATIRCYLEAVLPACEQLGIACIVYDGSDGKDTKVICESLRQYKQLQYCYYHGVFDGKSMDEKVIDAYKEYAQYYEYMWICRDGLVVNLIEIYPQLSKVFESSPDLIVVDNEERDIKKIGSRSYFDCTEVFRDWCNNMITLGVTIVRGQWILKVIEVCPLNDTNYSLWNTIATFQYIAEHPFTAYSCIGKAYSYNPAPAETAFWNSSKQALWQWAERWYLVISGLPEIYDGYKAEVLHLHTYDFTPFGYSFLMRMKASGSLRLRDVRQYKFYIKQVTDKAYWKICLLAWLPIPKWILKKVMFDKNSSFSKFVLAPYHIIKNAKNVSAE